MSMIGASLSKPHIDHDNGPHAQNNAIYLSMYHLPHICSHTLVPETHVCLEMFHVFRYTDMLTCVYNCTQLRTTGATCVCHQDYKTGRGMRRHMV